MVQLIVGREKCEDARELLNSFDLVICQTSFDGTNFVIQRLHETLRAQTFCTEPRAGLWSENYGRPAKFPAAQTWPGP